MNRNCIKNRVAVFVLLALSLFFFSGSCVWASETTSAEKGFIRGNNVEIHAMSPSGSVVDGPVVDTLNSGFSVIILETRYSSHNEDRNKWYEILYTKNGEKKTGWVRYDFVDTSGRGIVEKGQIRYTDMDDVPIYSDVANISGSLVCRLDASYAVTVEKDGLTTGSDQYNYYYVTFAPPKNSNVSAGYIRMDHLVEKDPFQTDLEKEGFPEDYANRIQSIHELYPNWKFVPVYVGESARQAYNWNDVLAAECKVDVNQHYSQTAAKGLFARLKRFGLTLEANMLVTKAEEETDTLVEDVTGSGWVSAPKDLIAYYLDPRNFISPEAVNNGTFFQFESLRREDFQNKTGVKKILEGTFMNEKVVEEGKTYADIFMEAGEAYGVSPYHLAARVRQEQGVEGTSPLISGNYSEEYKGYYNYYNVGATGKNEKEVWENGLEYAKGTDENTLRPWNTRYKALMGGSKFVASKYAKCNDYTPARRYSQDTLYFQKFNVKKINGKVEASHQYMQNVAAPSSEAKLLKRAHPVERLKEEELVFKIPVYANMPAQPCPKP